MRVGIRNVGAATSGTIAGNVLSLALPFMVTAWFQSGEATDAYFYALGAILFLNVTVSVALESATTPYVVTMLVEKYGAVPRFLRRVQRQGVAVCAALVAIGIAVTVFAILPLTSFTTLQQADVRDTLLVLSPLPILITWNSVLAGACYAVKVFGTPTATVALRTAFAVLFGFVLREQLGLSAVAVGLVVGEVVRTLVLEATVARVLPATHVTADSGHTPRAFWKAAGPQAISMSLGGLSPVVDKTVAIGVGAGAVTVLELSQRLVYTPILLLLSGVGLVLGSRWAGQIAVREWSSLRAEYRRTMRWVMVLGTAIVVVAVPSAFVLRSTAQSMFSVSDPTLLAVTFSAAAVGIPFALASQVSVRLLLAARETRVMPVLTVLVLVLNLGLDVALVRVMGLPGIALASAIVNVFNFVVYGVVARRVLIAEPRVVSVKPAEGVR